jgi:hypothetical protein
MDKIVALVVDREPMVGDAGGLLDRHEGALAGRLRARDPIAGGGERHQQGMIVLGDAAPIRIVGEDQNQGGFGVDELRLNASKKADDVPAPYFVS